MSARPAMVVRRMQSSALERQPARGYGPLALEEQAA